MKNEELVLYLTFDDGPSPEFTLPVLNLLKKYQVQATFFLIANKASREKKIVTAILHHGHSIGNHSLDHRYSVFFKGEKALRTWILQAETLLKELGVSDSVGFRPPAGVRTPQLSRALKSLNISLVLWDVRFFDRLWPWTKNKALRSLNKLRSGSIVLLHDVQRSKNFNTFLQTLEFYIIVAQEKGFQFRRLESHLEPSTKN